VLHVEDPHAPAQAAGYLKHVHSNDTREQVCFRGQSKLYGSLEPSLFRGSKRAVARGKRTGVLHKRIQAATAKNKIFCKFDAFFREPLLQHYGFRTTWIDLVDNVWVALWFACNEAKATGPFGQYFHFEERQPVHWKDHVYVILVGSGFHEGTPHLPGLFRGPNTELVDLRMGVPSIFLRPHSQHGVLFEIFGV